MSKNVGVHGIGASQSGSFSMDPSWRNGLADGIERAGDADLAATIAARQDRDWFAMAHYGYLFAEDRQLEAVRRLLVQTDSPSEPSSQDLMDFQEEIAVELLKVAAVRAADPLDRAKAEQFLRNPRRSAWGGWIRSALKPLAEISWFAKIGFDVVVNLVPTVAEVSQYLTDDSTRRAAQARVLELIDDDTEVVIAHSLGSIVAFEALHTLPTSRSIDFITLGSPLGIRHVVRKKLQFPETIPPAVRRWHNFADNDDLVALEQELGGIFKPSTPTQLPIVDVTTGNGSSPHNAVHYLITEAVGVAVVASQRGTEPAS